MRFCGDRCGVLAPRSGGLSGFLKLLDRFCLFGDCRLDIVLHGLADVGIENAVEIEHGEHGEDTEQVQRDRRYEMRAFAGNIAASQISGRNASIGKVRQILLSTSNRLTIRSLKKARNERWTCAF